MADQIETPSLARAESAQVYASNRDALEWSLAQEAVIGEPLRLESKPSWKFEPYPHQLSHLVDFSHGLPSLLIADEPGLGKTAAAGLAIAEFSARGRGKALVVCSSVMEPFWRRELAERFALSEAPAISSYRAADERWEELSKTGFGLLVLDDAHRLASERWARLRRTVSDGTFPAALWLSAAPSGDVMKLVRAARRVTLEQAKLKAPSRELRWVAVEAADEDRRCLAAELRGGEPGGPPSAAKLRALGSLLDDLRFGKAAGGLIAVAVRKRAARDAVSCFLQGKGIQQGVVLLCDEIEDEIPARVEVLVNFDLPWDPVALQRRADRLSPSSSFARTLSVANLALSGTVEETILRRALEKLMPAARSAGELDALLCASGFDGEADSSLEARLRELAGASLSGQDAEADIQLVLERLDPARRPATAVPVPPASPASPKLGPARRSGRARPSGEPALLHMVEDRGGVSDGLGRLAYAWVLAFGGELQGLDMGRTWRCFEGRALLKVTAEVAHDRCERLVEATCSASIHRLLEGGPLEDPLDPSRAGIVAAAFLPALEDPDILEFCRFYRERDASSPPRVRAAVVGLEGVSYRVYEVKARYRLGFDGPYSSSLCLAPAFDRVEAQPAMGQCAISGQPAPEDCLGRDAKGRLVLRRFLAKTS